MSIASVVWLQVWEKQGEAYLTLGLYVDLNEKESDDTLPISEDPAFAPVVPATVPTSPMFSQMVDSSEGDDEYDSRNKVEVPPESSSKVMSSRIPGPPAANGIALANSSSGSRPLKEAIISKGIGSRMPTYVEMRAGPSEISAIEQVRRGLTPPHTRQVTSGQLKTPFAILSSTQIIQN